MPSEVNSFLCAIAVKLIKMMAEPKDGERREYTFTFLATREGDGAHIDKPTLSWKSVKEKTVPQLLRERGMPATD